MIRGDGQLTKLALFILSSTVYFKNLENNHIFFFNNTKKKKKRFVFSGCDSKIPYLLGHVCLCIDTEGAMDLGLPPTGGGNCSVTFDKVLHTNQKVGGTSWQHLFSSPVLLKYNWHTAPYKFKVCRRMTWHTPWRSKSHTQFGQALLFWGCFEGRVGKRVATRRKEDGFDAIPLWAHRGSVRIAVW